MKRSQALPIPNSGMDVLILPLLFAEFYLAVTSPFDIFPSMSLHYSTSFQRSETVKGEGLFPGLWKPRRRKKSCKAAMQIMDLMIGLTVGLI